VPNIARVPLRMNCSGLNLVEAIDRMTPGNFPYLFNVRVLEEGRIDGRPGYTEYLNLQGGDFPNSIRRFNDPDFTQVTSGYTFIGGGSSRLYAGTPGHYNPIDTGYSGSPLSLLAFRPDQSPESWMYVYDQNKLVKVSANGTVQQIGVRPPGGAPSLAYGPPAMATITDGATGSWTPTSGSASSGNDRTNGSGPTVASILYDSGTTGWACVNPTVASQSTWWAGERMRITMGGETEVLIREINPAITNTTISGIYYDAGNTGLCSIVLTGSPAGLVRNSLIQLNTEIVRVLNVIPSADGINYSVRCSTTGTHAATETVIGLLSWYVYTNLTHAAGETITVPYVAVNGTTSTGDSAVQTISLNASQANGRPIDPANDWLHISIFVQNPQFVTSVVLTIDISDGTFKKNYWTWTIPGTELNQSGGITGGDTWTDLSIPISSGVQNGNSAASFATIAALKVGVVTTSTSTFGFGCWYLFGTYGPEIQPNSPVGYQYQYRYRQTGTGAYSIPGPETIVQMFPLREEVIVTVADSTQAGVDTIDLYRFGGTIGVTFLYIGSLSNTQTVFYDTYPDSVVLGIDQPPDLTAIQPWPILALPLTGQVNVTGNSVQWVSGSTFPLDLLNNTVIQIAGTAYEIQGQPTSTTTLKLFKSAGLQANVPYSIASPTLFGQPLPFAFGPLQGPFAPVAFALGDPINAGTLYFSNTANLDAASDQNTLELCGPSEPLISGDVWNGVVFVGSRDHIFLVRYSFLSSTPFQYQTIPSPSGMWCRWCCCATPLGVAFLGRDGIYIATENGAASITDGPLYPLFPHDGQPAAVIYFGSNTIYPVDMTKLTDMRLNYCDSDLYFSYIDTAGNSVVLRFEIPHKRWFMHVYHDGMSAHYNEEGDLNGPNPSQMLLLSRALPIVWLAGGDTDNGMGINSLVLTPSADFGDERGQKLYIDAIVQADGIGTLQVAAAYNNGQQFSAISSINCGGSIQQSIINLSSLNGTSNAPNTNLGLYRNIGAKFYWTGGPSGPRIYAWEPSGYLQPYLSTFLMTQFFGLDFPGWKHTRRLFPGLISNAPVLFTIFTQDGRTYGPYTIPSTNARFRILPQMMDSTIKDLAFSFQLDGQGVPFAFFPEEFSVELKGWTEPSYIPLAIFKA